MADLSTNTPPGTPLKVDVNGIHVDTTVTKPMVVKVPVSIPLLHQQTTVGLSMLASTLDTKTEADTMLAVHALPTREVSLSTEDFEAVLRFDYNSSELREDVKILLQQLTQRLPQGSTITIAGSADIIGSEQRNRALEQQRANNTEAYISGMAPGKFRVTVSQQDKKFDNSLPQGRFLNRCIRVTAITP
jgi:outer membrane protein OmpA-like peptidoglycan-associated protein